MVSGARQAPRASYAAFRIRRGAFPAGPLSGKARQRLSGRNDDKKGDCIGGTARCKEN